MSRWIEIAEKNELKDGDCKMVAMEDGTVIALFRVKGNFYALLNACPHMGGPLGEGRLEGATVRCPWHGWELDVKTGCFAVNPTEKAQPVYPTKIKNGKVQIKF